MFAIRMCADHKGWCKVTVNIFFLTGKIRKELSHRVQPHSFVFPVLRSIGKKRIQREARVSRRHGTRRHLALSSGVARSLLRIFGALGGPHGASFSLENGRTKCD